MSIDEDLVRDSEASLDALEQTIGQLAALPFCIAHIGVGVALGYADFRFADLAWRERRPALRAWFEALAESSSLPLVIYDIPYRTGVSITRDTLLALAAHPRIQAIKDCGGDLGKTLALLADPSHQQMSELDLVRALQNDRDGGQEERGGRVTPSRRQETISFRASGRFGKTSLIINPQFHTGVTLSPTTDEKAALADRKVDLITAATPFSQDPELRAMARTVFRQRDAVGLTQMIVWAARAGFIQRPKDHLVLVERAVLFQLVDHVDLVARGLVTDEHVNVVAVSPLRAPHVAVVVAHAPRSGHAARLLERAEAPFRRLDRDVHAVDPHRSHPLHQRLLLHGVSQTLFHG